MTTDPRHAARHVEVDGVRRAVTQALHHLHRLADAERAGRMDLACEALADARRAWASGAEHLGRVRV